MATWVNSAVPPDSPRQAIDVAVLDDLCSSVGGSAREVWTCIREDHAGQLTYLERCGFTERFRSWGAHLKLDSFDPSRWTGLVERLAGAGVRPVLSPDLHGDPDRDVKLMALQEALAADVVHFEPIVPKRSSDIIGPRRRRVHVGTAAVAGRARSAPCARSRRGTSRRVAG